MELAYRCRMRISEILDTKVKDIEKFGLNTRRIKGSNSALTLWSPKLKAAVDAGLKGQLRVPGMPIVNNGTGSPIRKSTFHTAWQRLMKKAVKQGVQRFTFHDLKAKGVSDFDSDKQLAGGHKDPRMTEIYDRKRKEVEATD